MHQQSAIQGFLASHRVAVVGVSRNPKDFSRGVFRELAKRGYDVVPVNPCASEIEGRACHPSLKGVSPPVEAALLMTPAAQSAAAVEDCLEAGVRRVWFHRGVGPGAASEAALRLCRDRGLEVVEGECPFMHLPGGSLAHRIHGFFRHLGDRRPQA